MNQIKNSTMILGVSNGKSINNYGRLQRACDESEVNSAKLFVIDKQSIINPIQQAMNLEENGLR